MNRLSFCIRHVLYISRTAVSACQASHSVVCKNSGQQGWTPCHWLFHLVCFGKLLYIFWFFMYCIFLYWHTILLIHVLKFVLFVVFLVSEWSEARFCGTAVSYVHIVPAPSDKWVWGIGSIIIGMGKPVFGEKPALVSFCSPKISHGLPWDWSRASVMRSWWLTAWIMVQCLPC
jgi:hypothetical protein